ncbi:TPA: serine/threonine protein phosphatase [Candidatus Geothermarchaeota archaeon]|nr:serine/threonine protein phosphatase [Candidatus Geothermarchaeota archaeon]HIQ13426.1 serine/threonine protein phosphatase [Thermoprotei archaeon]
MVGLNKIVMYAKELSGCEWWLLKKVFYYSRNYERVPLELLTRQKLFKEDYLRQCIRKLNRYGLVEFFQQPYEGIRLYTRGADLLALKKFSDRGLIRGVGRQIGVGKESDIIEVLGYDDKKYSLKVFRLGRISFKHVRKKRKYGPVEKWTPWIYRNIYAAKREFEILRYLYLRGASVPRPVYRIMHMLLMDFLDGMLLNDIDLEENEVNNFLEQIISGIKVIYDLGYVNGDLSQFNIFILRNKKVVFIDWPQAVRSDDPRAQELLNRDIKNIVRYFIRRYNVKYKSVIKLLSKYGFELIK